MLPFKQKNLDKFTVRDFDPAMIHMSSYVTGGLAQLFTNIDHGVKLPIYEYGEFTDNEGCFCPKKGILLGSRYKVKKILSPQGQSSTLILAEDIFNKKKMVVIKALKKSLYNLGAQESHCLWRLALEDSHNCSNTIKLLNLFLFDSHYCMVFPALYPAPLSQVFQNIPADKVLASIRKVALRLLTTLGFLKHQNVIHADLKPDNILLAKNDDLNSVTVIDFGNAIHHVHREVSLYYKDFELQTPLYRAPEVTFGMPFGTEIDMWSFGCILAELYLGEPLFIGHDKMKILQQMHDLLGPFPVHMFQRGKFFKKLRHFASDKEQPCGTDFLIKRLGCNDYSFADFIAMLLRYDPDERLDPFEAAKHPFLSSEFPLRYLIPNVTESSYPGVSMTQKKYFYKPHVSAEIWRSNPTSLDLLHLGTSPTSNDPWQEEDEDSDESTGCMSQGESCFSQEGSSYSQTGSCSSQKKSSLQQLENKYSFEANISDNFDSETDECSTTTTSRYTQNNFIKKETKVLKGRLPQTHKYLKQGGFQSFGGSSDDENHTAGKTKLFNSKSEIKGSNWENTIHDRTRKFSCFLESSTKNISSSNKEPVSTIACSNFCQDNHKEWRTWNTSTKNEIHIDQKVQGMKSRNAKHPNSNRRNNATSSMQVEIKSCNISEEEGLHEHNVFSPKKKPRSPKVSSLSGALCMVGDSKGRNSCRKTGEKAFMKTCESLGQSGSPFFPSPKISRDSVSTDTQGKKNTHEFHDSSNSLPRSPHVFSPLVIHKNEQKTESEYRDRELEILTPTTPGSGSKHKNKEESPFTIKLISPEQSLKRVDKGAPYSNTKVPSDKKCRSKGGNFGQLRNIMALITTEQAAAEVDMEKTEKLAEIKEYDWSKFRLKKRLHSSDEEPLETKSSEIKRPKPYPFNIPAASPRETEDCKAKTKETKVNEMDMSCQVIRKPKAEYMKSYQQNVEDGKKSQNSKSRILNLEGNIPLSLQRHSKRTKDISADEKSSSSSKEINLSVSDEKMKYESNSANNFIKREKQADLNSSTKYSNQINQLLTKDKCTWELSTDTALADSSAFLPSSKPDNLSLKINDTEKTSSDSVKVCADSTTDNICEDNFFSKVSMHPSMHIPRFSRQKQAKKRLYFTKALVPLQRNKKIEKPWKKMPKSGKSTKKLRTNSVGCKNDEPHSTKTAIQSRGSYQAYPMQSFSTDVLEIQGHVGVRSPKIENSFENESNYSRHVPKNPPRIGNKSTVSRKMQSFHFEDSEYSSD